MFRFVAVGAVAWAACTPHPVTPPAPPTARQAPVAVPKIDTEEEYTSTRSGYETLAVRDPARRAVRTGLEAFLLKNVARALDGGHLEEAYDQFRLALTLWDADELAAPEPDRALAGAADRLERALRRRGQHQEVLTTLAVEITLGADPTAERRFGEVTAWLRSGGSQSSEDFAALDGRERLVEDLEAVAKVWPSPFAVNKLRDLYLERPDRQFGVLNRRVRRGQELRELLGGGSSPTLGYELARLYLRVGRLDDAVAALRKLENQPGDDAQLRGLLDKLAAPSGRPADAIAVAMQFAQPQRDDRDVAERVCRDAARRFTSAPEPRLCVGQLALSLGRLGVATASFEEAVKLEPGRREAWEALARIYQERLVMLVSDENLDVKDLEPRLRRVEAFYAEADKRFADRPLRPSMAGALFEIGRGYFNGGRIAEATRYLERSVAMEPSVLALELLGQMRLKKGEPREAAALFERAVSLPKPDKEEQLFWRAKLRRELGDAFEAMNDAGGAEAARKAALSDWEAVVGMGHLTQEGLAEAGLERAKLAYQLGERDEALRQFERAIDALPDRGGTYADVIAFLVPRGELEEALDAYHRALGRNEVTDYLKVYCSLWVVDLARRAGQPEDPLATAYLKSTDGAKWYDDLARWATGRTPEAKLMERADTPARKAESAFYRAMRALEAGDRAGAIKLWRQVLDTDMMAFFEYDMAAYYLKREGAPTAPVLKSKPAKDGARESTPQQGKKPPEGSI
jgi:tetratricopeptide (TPR) repeat protein